MKSGRAGTYLLVLLFSPRDGTTAYVALQQWDVADEAARPAFPARESYAGPRVSGIFCGNSRISAQFGESGAVDACVARRPTSQSRVRWSGSSLSTFPQVRGPGRSLHISDLHRGGARDFPTNASRPSIASHRPRQPAGPHRIKVVSKDMHPVDPTFPPLGRPWGRLQDRSIIGLCRVVDLRWHERCFVRGRLLEARPFLLGPAEWTVEWFPAFRSGHPNLLTASRACRLPCRPRQKPFWHCRVCPCLP